jgi:hypothetical protein
MSFKSRKPPETPQLPQQPAPVEMMDFIDELTGVETTTVTMPDGRKRRVTKRLQLTPQEQQILSQADNLLAKALNNIETLYKYDPTSVVNYQPFIQTFSDVNSERAADLAQIGNFGDIANKVEAFRTMNSDLMNRAFDRQERMQEEVLAKRGLQRSTMAAEQRAAMAGERTLATQQADIAANMYGEDLAQRQLGRENMLYDTREKERLSRLQQAELGYNLERQKLEDAEHLRQQAIAENQGWIGTAQGIKAAEQDRAKLALLGNQLALGTYNAQASDQNQRFNNDMNRVHNQYGMNLAQFNSKPASFGEQLRNTGIGLGSMYLTSQLPGFGTNSNLTDVNNWINPNTAQNNPVMFGQNVQQPKSKSLNKKDYAELAMKTLPYLA